MLKILLRPVKLLNMKFHLKYKCPNCPKSTRQKRNIKNQGECFWFSEWSKGNPDIKSYYTYTLMKKLGKKIDPYYR